MSKRLLAGVVLLTAVIPSIAGAYGIAMNLQVLPQNIGDPNLYYVELGQDLGPTSISGDSGDIYSPFSDSGGRIAAIVDIASGTIRSSGSAFGPYGMAGAALSFTDMLTFDLPDGMTSTMVGFSITVDGTYTPSSPSFDYVTGYAGVSLGGATADGSYAQGAGEAFINRTYSGQVLVYDGTAVGVSASLFPFVQTYGNVSSAYFDLSNTARVALQLEPGVTFTSESGSFLTAVPLPAAAWLLLSGLAGLGFVGRRRTAA